MLLVVTYADDSEEAFQVGERTRLKPLLKDGYWTFRTLAGGEVAIASDQVERVEFGQVTFADERGRIEADGAGS